LRLGIVISAYNRRGGLERVAVEYARGLVARGHEVVVFAQTWEVQDEDRAVRFVRVGGLRSQIALRAATFPFAAARAVARVDLDNIVSFGSVLSRPCVVRLPGAHRSWWEVANREWPVTTFDGLRRRLNPHHHIILASDRHVLGRGIPSAVLAAGDWAADEIRFYYPAVVDKVRVLPDGVNLEEFSFDPKGRETMRAAWEVGDSPLLFTVATEMRRKGLGTLFESFRVIRERVPDARLVVAGRAPAGDVRALAVAHRLGREVRAVGFVPDLRAAYSAADALIFPTRFDPWGLPIAESLACGTPVAVSARAGAAAAVTDGVNGALIPDPTDPVGVAHAAVRALSLPSDRAGARASVEHLRWENVVAQLEQVLEQTAL